MSNNWIVNNRSRVQKLLYELDEAAMRHTYDGVLNITLIKSIISDAYKEVNRLEGLLKLKSEEAEALRKEIGEMVSKISGTPAPKGKGKGRK